MSSDFADSVAKLCYECFENLPKTGKPRLKQEWTLLAAIVISSDELKQRLKVVSLSTGTKCLGYSQLTENGDVVFDSHAEVLSRRALLRFLYHQMSVVLDNQHSIVLFWDEINSKFDIKPGIKFHLFISHVPCGDAAIFPKHTNEKHSLSSENQDESSDDKEINNYEKAKKRLKTDSSNNNTVSNERDISLNTTSFNDLYRTGAKCVESGVQDPKEPGLNFHVIGALRTKPGRGDPTWSMSCSDKIALWNVCGIQGALLSLLLVNPIYISSLIFGKCPLDKKAVERAIVTRISTVTDLSLPFQINKPEISQSSLTFQFSKDSVMKENQTAVPSPASIIWCDIPNFLNISINGRKQGITKKNMIKPSSRLEVCKSVLFEKFLNISLKLHSDLRKTLLISKKDTYMDCKLKAKQYKEAKLAVLRIFDGWKKKPDRFQQFTCSNGKEL